MLTPTQYKAAQHAMDHTSVATIGLSVRWLLALTVVLWVWAACLSQWRRLQAHEIDWGDLVGELALIVGVFIIMGVLLAT